MKLERYVRWQTCLVLLSLVGCASDKVSSYGSAYLACSNYYPSNTVSDISNLALWLDAQDTATLFENSDCSTGAITGTGNVGCWKDKSTNARHFTQTTAGRRPSVAVGAFQSLNAVKFTESSQTILKSNTALYGSSGNTVFLALEVPRNDQDRQILDAGPTGGSRRTIATDSVNLFFSGASSYFYHPASYTHHRILTVVENGASSSISESGYAYTTTGSIGAGLSASGTPTTLGGRYSENNYFIDSMVAEVIVFNRILSASEVSSVQGWLSCRYGIAL